MRWVIISVITVTTIPPPPPRPHFLIVMLLILGLLLGYLIFILGLLLLLSYRNALGSVLLRLLLLPLFRLVLILLQPLGSQFGSSSFGPSAPRAPRCAVQS